MKPLNKFKLIIQREVKQRGKKAIRFKTILGDRKYAR